MTLNHQVLGSSPSGVTIGPSFYQGINTFRLNISQLMYLMLQAYPDVKVVIVMDNASYHRSRATLAALSLFAQRLHVVWLPRYCPFLNAIERFWLHLKSLAAANCLHRDLADLIAAIDHTILNQNQPDHPDRLNFVHHFPLSA